RPCLVPAAGAAAEAEERVSSATTAPKPRPRGIYRDDCDDAPPAEQPAGPPPTPTRLLTGIDECLRDSGLTYYQSPAVGTAGGRVRYDAQGDIVLYDPGFLDEQRPYIAAFWLADAYAAHVLNLE